MGLRLKRYQAVVLDSIIACGLTIWAEFQSTFSLYMKEFVGIIILWIAPWLGIYLVDWLLRKYRYSASELQRTDRDGLYFTGSTGVNWNAIIAFVVGMVCATLAFSKAPPPVNLPFHWMTPISNHFGSSCAANLVHGVCSAGWYGGADFSVPTGVILAGLVYFILEKATGNVARQVTRQKELEPNP
jgi:cytosine/uracil/thiamine/allantoin permease